MFMDTNREDVDFTLTLDDGVVLTLAVAEGDRKIRLSLAIPSGRRTDGVRQWTNIETTLYGREVEDLRVALQTGLRFIGRTSKEEEDAREVAWVAHVRNTTVARDGS